jgi:hypothetical protein
MSLDQATFYRQRIQALRREIGEQDRAIAALAQRLEMMHAELFAFESALQLQTPRDEKLLATEEYYFEPAAVGEAAAGSNNGSQPSQVEMLRAVLRGRSKGIPPAEIFAELEARGHKIKKDYLYALLSRLTARGELTRRGGNYSLKEQPDGT